MIVELLQWLLDIRMYVLKKAWGSQVKFLWATICSSGAGSGVCVGTSAGISLCLVPRNHIRIYVSAAIDLFLVGTSLLHLLMTL